MISSVESLAIPEFKKSQVSLITELIKSYVSDSEIYLFGSCANGIVSEDSDVDLVILVNKEPSRSDRLSLRNYIDKKTDYQLEFDILMYERERFFKLVKEESFERKIYRSSLKLL